MLPLKFLILISIRQRVSMCIKNPKKIILSFKQNQKKKKLFFGGGGGFFFQL